MEIGKDFEFVVSKLERGLAPKFPSPKCRHAYNARKCHTRSHPRP